MTATLVFRSARCTGCFNCVVACKQENRTGPGVAWLRIERHEARAPDRIAWQLRTCIHCVTPDCVAICPTGALSQSATGVVSVDPGTCLAGCELCLDACAYEALYVVPDADYFDTDLERAAAALPHQRHEPGTTSLCTLCAHRGDGATACTVACPTGALTLEDAGPGARVRYATPLAGAEPAPLPRWDGS